MEEIAKKKMELERIKQERQVIDEYKRKKNLEIQTIDKLIGKDTVDANELM